MEHIKKYLWLFRVNLYISSFTFGGGYVVIPMIRKYFVEKKQMFSEEELMDMAAIAQSSPGAIAVNLSMLAGYRTAGLAGAVISCVAAVLPPLVILSVVCMAYQEFRQNETISAVLKGMEAGVAALIVDFVLDMFAVIFKQKKWLNTILIILAFAGSYLLNVNVALILVICVFVSLADGYIQKGRDCCGVNH